MSSQIFKSINPKNGKLLKTYETITSQQMFNNVEKAFNSYKYMRNQGLQGYSERIDKSGKLKQLLLDNKQKMAETITNEVGKPLRESVGEIDKCIGLIDYYNKNAIDFSQEETLQTRFKSTTVINQPWGPTIGNFFSLIFYSHSTMEFSIVVIIQDSSSSIVRWKFDTLKTRRYSSIKCLVHHRSNQSEVTYSQVVKESSGFDQGEFQNLFISHDQCDELFADERIRAIKFVGSTVGGKRVAEKCGKYMKKGAFELGGSDPFIVFNDADIDLAVTKAISARLHTNGQACNNAKRFIVQSKVYDQFKAKLIEKVKAYVKIGDPLDANTTIGPLAMARQVTNLKDQVSKSISKGAKIVYGELDYKNQDPNLKEGFYFHPLILENIKPGQPAFNEELFGPVFSLFNFQEDFEAVDLANATPYGLNASVFTKDLEKAYRKASKLEVGSVFINEAVATDPSIPGGGVKDSGYGRECYKDGLYETFNRKTIIVGGN